MLVEPLGEWGRGAISLVEIPTDLEINDNVVAFWTPDGETQAGDELAFDYRLVWGAIEEADDRIARVVGLRTGEGGVSGLEKERKIVGERKFVIDFRGKPLEALPASAKVEATVNVAGAGDVRWVVSCIEANGDWRLAIDLMPDGDDPIELSANLEMEGRILSETWHYQWRRNDGKSPRV